MEPGIKSLGIVIGPTSKEHAMRIALALGFTLGFTLALSGTALAQDPVAVPPAPNDAPAVVPVQPANPLLPVAPPPPAAPAVQPQALSAADVALYHQLFAAERAGSAARIKSIAAKINDPVLLSYAEAARLQTVRHPKLADLIAWLGHNRDLAIADRIYRVAVANSTKTVRRNRKRIKVAIVTNIPAPISVGRRSGGYEDLELPEPTPSSEAARAILAPVLADIKAGTPDAARARLQNLQAQNGASPEDIAILSHRIAASYLAEGMDAQAFQLASSVTDTHPCPRLEWDAGFAAYRLGQWNDASAHLEKLAQDGSVMGTLRAQAAFWAARARMQSGDPQRVVSLLAAAAKEEPTFYGLIAERMLGMDTGTGFSDAVLNQNDYTALMAEPAARRAVALWQIGETDYVGPELNRAFVENNEQLDPAMAALARVMGITNVELRASEKSVSHGLLLTGLFPVPQYQPEGGYHIDQSLVLAFARIESRFQNGATSPVGARGIMQFMPKTAELVGGKGAANQLYDPGYSLALGQRYIAQLLDHLDGSLLKLGGAYNAGPLAVNRWIATKAGKDDPLLFVESIPVAETRSYVRRLMEYHWMYRRRFGEDARSLDETARGAWPIYHPALPEAPKLDASAPAVPLDPDQAPDQTQLSDASL
jgi:soluble lytic murein transglycosylase-like protein